jgi:membrane associated rhomboid family serine protease
VGGLSALIGIFVGWLLKDQPGSVLAFGTLGGFVAGAVGGLIMHAIARRRVTPGR